MPRVCTVCSRPDRPEIDRALVTGEAKRAIARRRGIGHDALERHARAHLPAAIVKAQVVEDVANGDTLLRQIQDLQRRTLVILGSAERRGDARVALKAIHQALEGVALLSRLSSEARRLAEEREDTPGHSLAEMFAAYDDHLKQQKKFQAAAQQLPPQELEPPREDPGAAGTEGMPKER